MKSARAADPRRLAWETLQAVEAGAFADAELAGRLGRSRLDGRDRALATRLVYGTLAWQGWLDHIISTLSRPASRLDPPVRVVLRLGLFQLSKLSRVPDFAAVDTAVRLARGFRGGSASGLVNAVLRRYLRERDHIAVPADDRAAALAVTGSHPRWLVERWIERFGYEEAETLCAANNEPAPTVLRVNRLRADRDEVVARLNAAGVRARATGAAPYGVVLDQAGDPTALPGFAEGEFTAQGEASQLVAHLTGARPGSRILDACAAPGGKSTAMAELAGDEGEIVAIDRNRAGLGHLERECGRLGLRSIRTVSADAVDLAARCADRFDIVLLDAPCTGLGTLRQHPEIKWRRRPEDIERARAVQLEILRAVAPRVRPGGRLVYATCSVAPEENEAVIDELVAGGVFEPRDARTELSGPARELADERGCLRTFPHRGGLDGFFAALLQRRDASPMVAP